MLDSLQEAIDFAEMKISPIGLVLASLLGGGIIFVLLVTSDALLAVIAGISISAMIISLPTYIGSKKIAIIEKNFPDVLKQFATTIKAGGTIEYALQDIVDSKYQYISDEIALALLQMNEGVSFEDALTRMAKRTRSDLVYRAVRIIVSAKKAGASMSTTMESIANDIRDIYQIQRERASRTTMPVWFIRITTTLIGPFTFGLGISVISGLAAKAGGGLNLDTIFRIFIAVEALMGGFMVPMMQYGVVKRGLTQIPIMVLVAYLVYGAGKAMGGGMIG